MYKTFKSRLYLNNKLIAFEFKNLERDIKK